VSVVWVALLLLVLVGIVGGILVVPLNALLQHRGYALLSAGRSVAVQGFNENLSVLCMLGLRHIGGHDCPHCAADDGVRAVHLPLAIAPARPTWTQGTKSPSG